MAEDTTASFSVITGLEMFYRLGGVAQILNAAGENIPITNENPALADIVGSARPSRLYLSGILNCTDYSLAKYSEIYFRLKRPPSLPEPPGVTQIALYSPANYTINPLFPDSVATIQSSGVTWVCETYEPSSDTVRMLLRRDSAGVGLFACSLVADFKHSIV